MPTHIPRLARMTCAAAALALAASACAGGGSAGNSASGTSSSPLPTVTGPVTITFDEVFSSGTLKTSMEHLVSAFEAADPKITVKLNAYSDYGTLYTKEKAEIQAGDAPTLGQAYESWAADYAKSQVIAPISDLAGTAAPAELSTFYTGVRNDLYLPDGKLWMWPLNKSVLVAYYDSDLLSADGLSVPTTWDQFGSALKSSSKGGVTGISIDPGSASSSAAAGEEWFEVLAASNGAKVFGVDGSPQFTTPAAVNALQYLANLKAAGALAVGSNYPGETALGAKKGLIDISSSAGYYYETQAVGGKFTLGTMALPAGPAGAATTMAGANIVAFASATPEQKAAAWQFLQFVAAPAQQSYFAAHTGYLPITAQALTQPELSAFVSKNPYVSAAVGELNTAFTDPAYPWVEKCVGYLSTAMQAALDNGAAPASALATAQNSCQTAKAQS
jgi:multiple sugar transport system substrate-binding protein